jgi:hypothetical protein
MATIGKPTLLPNERVTTVGAYYRAMYGLGLSETSAASAARVSELFLNDKIVAFEHSPVGVPERTILRSITFASGAVMHLANSNEGACVYLIEEASDEISHISAVGDFEDSAPDGAQDGRAAVPADKGV